MMAGERDEWTSLKIEFSLQLIDEPFIEKGQTIRNPPPESEYAPNVWSLN